MRRPHYAWAVCLGGALALFSVMGLGVNIFSVYQPYIIAQNGFTNAQGSWITTIRSLFVLFAMLTVNQLCARFGLRKVFTLGMGLMTLSCLCFGMAGSFPAYCGAAALTGLAYGYGGMVPLSLMVGRWFRDRRSFALGLASAGSGVATIFAPALITRLIEERSLRTAFLAEGGFVLSLGLLVWLLTRDCPEELGLEPYRLGGGEDPLPPVSPAPEGMTRGLWGGMLLAAFLLGAPGGPGFSHLTVLYTTSGYSGTEVAAFVSCLGLVLCGGKVLCGQIYDTLGGWRANFYIFSVTMAGLGLCALAPLGGRVLPFVAMALFGLGLPISSIPFAAWAADLRGAAGYEGAVRGLTVSYALGTLLFGPLPGVLADRLDSYVPSYVIFILAALWAMLLVQLVYHRLGVGKRSVRT